MARFYNPVINLAYGSFYDTLDQTGTAGSIQAMRYRNTDMSNNISITGVNSNEIRMAKAGKYNIAFSAQLHELASSSIVNIWLAKNGTDIPHSNTRIDISANSQHVVAAWNFFVEAKANDYFEIKWSADNSNMILDAIDAGAYPATPSVILTVNQVDSLPRAFL